MDTVKIALILLITGLFRSAWAETHQVILVGPPDTPQLQAFRQSLTAQLVPDWQVGYVPLSEADKDLAAVPNALRITLGRDALQWALAQPLQTTSPPILSLYVSQREFEFLIQNQGRPPHVSAIYADAPLVRQIRLARLIAPNAVRIGVLSYQPMTLELPEDLQRQAQIGNLPLNQVDSLSRYLSETIRDCDILVGTDDPDLFNSVNIKPILMTAYRHNKFLIGPRFGFVGAGSLASTYSSQSDTLHELAAWLRQYVRDQQWPPPRHAREFSVVINSQVARSLNLVLPDQTELKRKLSALEGLK